MLKIKLKIEGMKCGMCEAHVCDSIRKIIKPMKIKASHKTGEVIFLVNDIDSLEPSVASIEAQGYKVLSKTSEEYIKKGLFYKL